MIKMDYGDAEHIKNLEATFMALLDDVDKRQNIWAKLRKKKYNSQPPCEKKGRA